MERWLLPKSMTGKMLRFDFRAGGGYRMRLTYKDGQDGRGKTSDDSDEVEDYQAGLNSSLASLARFTEVH